MMEVTDAYRMYRMYDVVVVFGDAVLNLFIVIAVASLRSVDETSEANRIRWFTTASAGHVQGFDDYKNPQDNPWF